jgi:hypothetical protein
MTPRAEDPMGMAESDALKKPHANTKTIAR